MTHSAFGTLHAMPDVNQVTLVGPLMKPPVTQWFPGGRVRSTLTLVTREAQPGPTGEPQIRTEWHTVVLWDEWAELAEEKLSQGDTVNVTGRLKSRSWTDAEGRVQRVTEVIGLRFDSAKADAAEDTDAAAVPKAPHPVQRMDIPL